MASTRLQVLAAVQALVQGALPFATVKRVGDGQAASKPSSVPPGGLALINNGDPGDPEVDLSPVTYNYEHRIPITLRPYTGVDPETALDAMGAAIGAAVSADRTLGGLCMWLEVEAASEDDVDAYGAPNAPEMETAIVASYSTPDPLN